MTVSYADALRACAAIERSGAPLDDGTAVIAAVTQEFNCTPGQAAQMLVEMAEASRGVESLGDDGFSLDTAYVAVFDCVNGERRYLRLDKERRGEQTSILATATLWSNLAAAKRWVRMYVDLGSLRFPAVEMISYMRVELFPIREGIKP